MATRATLFVVMVLLLQSTPALASTTRVMKAWQEVRALHAATVQLSADIHRIPTAAEWPTILLNPPGDAGWHGPYIGYLKPDPWGAVVSIAS